MFEEPGSGAHGTATLRRVFHLQLRQSLQSARAFNLTLTELRADFLSPWIAGQTIEWSDRKWAPDQAKLTVYEGPELPPSEIGMGRGWANAARAGEDVTERVLSEQRQIARGGEPLQALKLATIGLCAQQPVNLVELPRLAAARWPQLRASECLALAEQTVWELLHERRASLVSDSGGVQAPVSKEHWRGGLLAWSSWGRADPGHPTLAIRAGPDAEQR